MGLVLGSTLFLVSRGSLYLYPLMGSLMQLEKGREAGKQRKVTGDKKKEDGNAGREFLLLAMRALTL